MTSIALIALLLVAALGVGLGELLVRGYSQRLQDQVTADFKQGQAELEAGQTALKRATAERDLGQVRSAEQHFDAAPMLLCHGS